VTHVMLNSNVEHVSCYSGQISLAIQTLPNLHMNSTHKPLHNLTFTYVGIQTTTKQLYYIIYIYTVGYATINKCYNEQFLSIKSGCYNERRGILSADVAHACAWCVVPPRFD
jgi:hypothetical protein